MKVYRLTVTTDEGEVLSQRTIGLYGCQDDLDAEMEKDEIDWFYAEDASDAGDCKDLAEDVLSTIFNHHNHSNKEGK